MPQKELPGTSAGGAYTPVELSKLTVPQLKAICKERKIPGYSKLGKQALVQKLVESDICVDGPAGTPAASTHTEILPGAPSLSTPHAHELSSADVTAPTSAAVIQSQGSQTADGSQSQSLKTVALASKASTKSRKPAPSQATVLNASEAVHGRDSSTTTCNVAGYAPENRSNSRPASVSQVQTVTPTASSLSLLDQPSRDERSRPIGPTKRKVRPNVESMPPPAAKKQRILSPSSTINIARPQPQTQVSSAQSALEPMQAIFSSVIQKPGLVHAPATTAVGLASAPAKRFKPLVVNKAKPSTSSPAKNVAPAPALAPAPAPARTGTITTMPSPMTQTSETSLAAMEDFEALTPALHPVSMPPKLAQRKRVKSWAIILSGLSTKERAVCVLVSRGFRYAVYLSASSILELEYRGRRNDAVLMKNPPAMTDMWPYLRAREAEAAHRQRVYEQSFLARIFQRCGFPNPISARLWGSPDDPRQLLIAIRFALTRAWFELSVGQARGGKDDPESWLRGTVVDVQQVVKGEVWSVCIEHAPTETRARRKETLYVLEATCEVVGRPARASDADSPALEFPVRADWSVYIAGRAAEDSTTGPLLSHLKWACQEDYEQGMSKLWLTRATAEGPAGLAKRVVAERYVLACVVGNSISGEWRSTHEMAQDFAGLPERVAASGRPKSLALNLYLPEHHHVESVHLTSSRGEALHSALAVVQTPHREYFILRENGMQVGCEEDGVALVWQEVLRCDHKGHPR